ncbi:hypothetical protein Q7C_195 [Methylophaga frappieri]|uniref:Uncharacterized protein n=1 Tax=Methylophaga frappieri (strain ATCC BAA-2434 / DSM 25690 / JAM7) TaxID=754477 RepID=I1YEN3_METFJ|nr:hypothetical protein [Methylophaga frappieri]AFJ01376.1 hypothetical protein Q7C_195 [Methylophaga frappieri]
MTTTKRKRRILLLLGVLFVIAFVPLADLAAPQLSEMLRITLTIYALARGLNAVISVMQGTELAIEPMGVGLTLTPGQILDPLNDLIEQVSTVLLLASASLGIQQIVITAADINLFRGLLALLIVLTAILVWHRPGLDTAKPMQYLLKLIVVLSVLRLIVPVTALVSHQAQVWLQHDRQQAVAVLDATESSLQSFQQSAGNEDKKWYQGWRDNLDIKAKLEQIKLRAEQAVEAAVYLLAEFLLIMVLLPLLLLIIGWRFVTRLLIR